MRSRARSATGQARPPSGSSKQRRTGVWRDQPGCRRAAEGRHREERLNAPDDYLYRSIDDVLARLAPILAEHRLCFLPQVIERIATDRTGEEGELLIGVTVRCAFHIVSAEDGSAHIIETFGEALDASDKGTAKAMQSAYKYAVLEAFCVPVSQAEDADARSHRLANRHAMPEPEDGWTQWGKTFTAALAACGTVDEVAAAQDSSRPLLASLSRERPELYKQIGETIAARRAVFADVAATAPAPPVASAQPGRSRTKRAPPARETNRGAAHA